MRRLISLIVVASVLVLLPRPADGYSVLTHELLIDLSWKALLEPLLLKRFPHTTPAGLLEAHAYAYGGCAIQDMGYYPFGNQFFSNLTHYVRSGDFIVNLLHDSRDVNEYAFALGALSHYVGDNIGHHDAVNLATALAFPRLKSKYGPVVTYDEDPHAHIRVEFAYDIDQLSHERLAPAAYLRFVGLRVSKRVLAQAFGETYSLPLSSLLGPARQAIRSYRGSVRSFLPRIAYAETVLHRDDFPPDIADEPFQIFLDHISQADFQTEWNRYRRRPGFTTHLLAFVICIIPKIGVLSDLAIKIPNPHAQDLYVRSVNRSIGVYGGMLNHLATADDGAEPIPNRDLDTGEKSRPGSYALTDETYAKLLHAVTKDHRPPTVELRQDILEYYSDPSAPITTKQNPKAWARVQKDLAVLRNENPSRQPPR